MQCGVAALTMILKSFGLNYSLEFVSEYCHVSREGVTMLGIKDAAKTLGLDAKAIFTSVDKISSHELPAILYWDNNHYVVLYKISRDGKLFHVADPGKGMLTLKHDEFVNHWIGNNNDGDCGIAMFFTPNHLFGTIKANSTTEEPKSLKFLLSYLNNYKKQFIFILLGLVAGCLFQLVMPFLTQGIVDRGIQNNDIEIVWLILLGELFIVLGKTIADFIRRWIVLRKSMKINISMISDFFLKLLKLPMAFFDVKVSGDLLQRMSDHTRIQSFLTGQVLSLIFSILTFIVFGIVLLIYNSSIFLVFSVCAIIYGAWVVAFLKRRKTLDYELFAKQTQNNNRTWQFISTIQEIKLHNCEKRRCEEWQETQNDLLIVQQKSLKLQQAQEAGSIFINEIKNIIITAFAANAVINGTMTLGAMLAIQYIVGQLNSPIQQLIGLIYSIQDVKISLERINEIHCRKNEEPVKMNLIKSFESSNQDISIDCENFKYDRHSLSNTLNDVSFSIPSGKVTAIVGSSGCGKTTLIKLLLGYYPVDNGAIKIGGKNINEYSLKWWRQQCGVVMQNGVIFSESIARNVAVDDNEINYERLKVATSIARIDEYIEKLPNGYNTIIGKDGRELSQGQKQRILIARAIYRNPPFIFLDEATNSLDATNERQIVDSLSEFYKGKTVVIVAHRLSTVMHADNIVVIDKGMVVETGCHGTLVNNKGLYYNLVRDQLALG